MFFWKVIILLCSLQIDVIVLRLLRDINENTSSLKAAWNRNIRGTLRWKIKFSCVWKNSFIYILFTEELNGFLETNCNLFFLFRVNNNQQKLLDEVFFPHLKNRFVSVLHLSKMYPAEACSAEICLPGKNLRAQLVDSSSAECVLCCRVQVGRTWNPWLQYERKRRKSNLMREDCLMIRP